MSQKNSLITNKKSHTATNIMNAGPFEIEQINEVVYNSFLNYIQKKRKNRKNIPSPIAIQSGFLRGIFDDNIE